MVLTRIDFSLSGGYAGIGPRCGRCGVFGYVSNTAECLLRPRFTHCSNAGEFPSRRGWMAHLVVLLFYRPSPRRGGGWCALRGPVPDALRGGPQFGHAAVAPHPVRTFVQEEVWCARSRRRLIGGFTRRRRPSCGKRGSTRRSRAWRWCARRKKRVETAAEYAAVSALPAPPAPRGGVAVNQWQCSALEEEEG